MGRGNLGEDPRLRRGVFQHGCPSSLQELKTSEAPALTFDAASPQRNRFAAAQTPRSDCVATAIAFDATPTRRPGDYDAERALSVSASGGGPARLCAPRSAVAGRARSRGPPAPRSRKAFAGRPPSPLASGGNSKREDQSRKSRAQGPVCQVYRFSSFTSDNLHSVHFLIDYPVVNS
jgi:hypothetical protein